MSLKQIWYRNKGTIDRLLWSLSQKVGKPIPFEKITIVPAPSPVLPTPPANRSSLPAIFDYPLELPIPCPGEIIYRLHDVHVAWHGSIIKGLRVFVPSLPYPFLEPELSGTFLLRQLKSHRSPQLTGEVGLIFDQWSIGNYFHWIAEVLPRLAMLRKYQPNCIVLLPGPNPPAFITQSVKAFGFERTYIMAPGEMLRIDNLIVAALPGFQGYITPSLVRESRDIILTNLIPHTLATVRPTRKVYVSRSLQKWRQLTNEAEVLAMLTNYGFETVYFEHLSFIEQIKLMQETQIFIGIHGANMTNILFMPTGGYVVEIMSEGYINLSYLHMSTSVGLNYSIVPSAVGSPPEVFHTYADIITDVKLVEEIIRPICEAVV